jgi:excinuclease UvrABC ATPase subunit
MVTYAARPQVDSITGLSPSISVDQRYLTNRSPRSTVGTATEVFTYLRVLWARIGHRPCPACGRDIPPDYHVTGDEAWDDEPAGGEPDEAPEGEQTLPCPHCGTPVPAMGMAHFSFNKPAGACPTCTGLGTVLRADVHRLVDHERAVTGGAVLGWHPLLTERNVATLHAAAEHYGFIFDAEAPVNALGDVQRDLLLYGVDSQEFRRHVPDVAPPATVALGRFEGVVTNLLRRYAARIEDADYRQQVERLLLNDTCPDCQGTRLRPESRRVTVGGLTIVDAARLPLVELATWIDALQGRLAAETWLVTEPIVADLHERVRRPVDVGVGYLTLERATPSLSAGEAQRLRLAALLGSGLTGVLYVLDEPTIGLHPADHARLIEVLHRLRDLGNTVLVVAHDRIDGWEHLDKVVTIDQQPIGRMPRSNAATYSDAFTPIREAFAATADARDRGLTSRHFSFNVPGGRCERCDGAGVLTVQMHFLPDVQVRCPACHGRRFKREVLAARYRGHDIAQVLDMTVEEALMLFADVPTAAARLRLMADVGLGYLQLGQPATTMSGGETQRIKLAKELGRRATGRTLYLLDEPTSGLHAADTARLLGVLQRLIDAGNTVVTIEHSLDVIRASDWVIDLGPAGGAAGGEVVAEGMPEQVAQVGASRTGAFLRGP